MLEVQQKMRTTKSADVQGRTPVMKERFTNVAQKTLDVFVKFASTKAITALKDD